MQSLRVTKGQVIRAEDHNALVDLAEGVTLHPGRMRGRRDPDGFIPRFEVRATATIGHAFKITVDEDGDDLLVGFSPAHVAGIVPTIDDLALDETDEAGNPPVLRVGKGAWIKRGVGERTLIFFRYELNRQDFTVEKVVPVAAPQAPARAPWTWHKLVAILVRQAGTVRVFPQMFLPQDFLAVDTTAAGGFRSLPFAAP